jgi:hypothetical protein
MSLAPIVLFVYARPDLTEQTLNSLIANAEAAESELFVFADGAKANATPETIERIAQVREVVKSRQWCKQVHLFESAENKGLARSVIAGVTQVVNQFGKAIIVEDDVSLSPYFLKFMNDALNLYADDAKVSGVASWNYFCPPSVSGGNFFLRHPDTIAWGVYQRSWAKFNPDTTYLIKTIEERCLGRYLNMENALDIVKMLKNQQSGKVDSWAVRWTASVVLEGMLTFYPQYLIARHEGYAAGTHFSGEENTPDKGIPLLDHPLPVVRIPIEESRVAVKAYINFARKTNNLWTRFWTSVRRFLNAKKK